MSRFDENLYMYLSVIAFYYIVLTIMLALRDYNVLGKIISRPSLQLSECGVISVVSSF